MDGVATITSIGGHWLATTIYDYEEGETSPRIVRCWVATDIVAEDWLEVSAHWAGDPIYGLSSGDSFTLGDPEISDLPLRMAMAKERALSDACLGEGSIP